MSAAIQPHITIEQFQSGQFDAAAFGHDAHIYMGWLYVREYDLGEAITRFDSALKDLTERLGVPDKYHATITWLFLLLINERAGHDEDWTSFWSRNPDLVTDGRSTLGRYYSDALLNSDRARRQFVLPDRLAS